MKETLGQRIRRLREEKELGLRETAKIIGISPAYLSRIETNEEKTPGEDVLTKLAKLLDEKLDELMSLAGRVPTDVKRFITKDPGLPQFLRTARERGYSAEDLQRLLKKDKEKK